MQFGTNCIKLVADVYPAGQWEICIHRSLGSLRYFSSGAWVRQGTRVLSLELPGVYGSGAAQVFVS